MTTKIEWTWPPGYIGESWNPVTGCTQIGPGCLNCYAERRAKLLAKNERVAHRERYEGFTPTCWPERLEDPLRWKKPRCVFVPSMGDLFHDQIPGEFVSQVLATMHRTPQHRYMILTKRPDNVLYWMQSRNTYNWIPFLANQWIGTSVENQIEAGRRIPDLLKIPAYHRFLSVEPLLEPVDLFNIPYTGGYNLNVLSRRVSAHRIHSATDGDLALSHGLGKIGHVVVGPETGGQRTRRYCNPDWIRSIIHQCDACRVPVFVKAFPMGDDISKDPEEWPWWARRQEWPE